MVIRLSHQLTYPSELTVLSLDYRTIAIVQVTGHQHQQRTQGTQNATSIIHHNQQAIKSKIMGKQFSIRDIFLPRIFTPRENKILIIVV